MKIDVEQARKRAKELVKSGAADRLADAQRLVARELGYPSWPALIHSLEPPTAERVIREADHRPDRALELLAEAPALREDAWVRLTLGDASGIAEAQAPGGPLALPPLFYVARSRVAVDRLPAARDLLARGANPNGPGGEEWTNLSIACSQGDDALARLLLESGAEPNDNDSLYHSLDPADDGCTRVLLEHGAEVPGTNSLWHALDYDRPDRVRMLLEHGADVAARDRAGRTAYQHAFRRGREDVAETLRELGAPTDLCPADQALNAISHGGSAAQIELDGDARDVLIELAMSDLGGLECVVDAVGAGFSARWGGGPRGTLLHQAAWFGRPDYVELLLRPGAEPDERVETEYATPLGWAAVGSRYSPEHPNDSFAATDGDWVAVAELLVAAGARVEAKFVDMAVPPLADWLAGI